MLPLRYQILGHFLVGLLVGYLLNLALTPVESEIEKKSEPFTTQSEMLAVSFVLHRDAPPEITDVQLLAEARVSVTQPGDYALSLKGEHGQTLYTLPFRATFIKPGEPPRIADEIHLILVVPGGRDIARVVLTAPQGAAEYALTPSP